MVIDKHFSLGFIEPKKTENFVTNIKHVGFVSSRSILFSIKVKYIIHVTNLSLKFKIILRSEKQYYIFSNLLKIVYQLIKPLTCMHSIPQKNHKLMTRTVLSA